MLDRLRRKLVRADGIDALPAQVLHVSVSVLVALLVGYHAISAWVTPPGAMQHYVTHLTLALLIVTVQWLHSMTEDRSSPWTALRLAVPPLVLLGVLATGGFFYVNAEQLELSQPFLTELEFAMGVLLIAVVVGLTWVVWGRVLTFVCVAGILFFSFGHLLPEPFRSKEIEPFIVVSYLAGMGTTRGIYNYVPLSADTIILLVVYGGLLRGTRVIHMFVEIGVGLGRLFRGGVAYSAVVVSTLIGMVTGQAVSNVALSGSMTIPTMMRHGFSAEKAGAIECLASNGSQLIPPIMGLGAFLMAAILGISYISIATAAILPAILYVGILLLGLSAMIQSDVRVGRDTSDSTSDWGLVAWVLPSFVGSFGILIGLLYLQYSGVVAGFWGIATLVLSALVRPARHRPNTVELIEGLKTGGVAAAKLALILAAIGMLAQTLITTGLSISLSRVMIDLSGHSVEIGLIIGMLISLVIGMGLPTPAAYSLVAIVVIPSLIDLGIAPIVAHFYGFYFAIYSSVTPPVAVAILTAVRISDGGFMYTALECLKLGATCVLLPFMLIAFPNTLGFPDLQFKTLTAAVFLLVASYMLACATYGNLRGALTAWQRILLLSGPVLFMIYLKRPELWLPVVATLAFTGVWLLQRLATVDKLATPNSSVITDSPSENAARPTGTLPRPFHERH